MSGIGESVSGEWNGDVDLNNGKLQQMYLAYRKHLNFINSISGEEEGDIKVTDCAGCRLHHLKSSSITTTKSL